PDNGTQYTMIIAIVCVVVIIAVILGVGIFCYKKRGKGYQTTSSKYSIMSCSLYYYSVRCVEYVRR
ncbi:hypothetical protein AB205_0028690, partial [Aquarana catesbeiana]